MSQIVHRKNIDFLFYEVFELAALLETPRFRKWDRAAVSGVLDVVQAIAEQEFLPCAGDLDANEPEWQGGRVVLPAAARSALQACADAGLFCTSFEEQIGGLQLPAMVSSMINGILGAANVALANYQFLTIANANMLNCFGTEAQKSLFLPPMLAGRWFGTMCLSETQAGSSLADIRTIARPIEGRLHKIVGSKMWISGGEHDLSENIVHMVLAKLPDSPAGVKGISLFIVPKYRVNEDGSLGEFNNVALAGLNHKMGQRGTTNCLLNFGESGDTFGYLVGEPNKGLSYMFQMMNEARISVGTSSIMTGFAGYLYSLEYARTRLQGRLSKDKDPTSAQVPIIRHADVKRMLLAQKSAVEGALALSCYCTMLVDQKCTTSSPSLKADLELLLELLTPIVKSWPSEHCLEANKLAIQVLGGYGYTRDYPVERLYRDNRLNHIHEGTFAIQGIDLLGRKVRMDDGRALKILTSRIVETVESAGSGSAFSDECGQLLAALSALEHATDAVLECPDLDLGLANATLYLDSFGYLVVGWLWLKQALVAQNKLGLSTPSADL
ncbi:MAG: acyl-CoA dehydrogenase, partial [Betaproteobacteria bacterium]